MKLRELAAKIKDSLEVSNIAYSNGCCGGYPYIQGNKGPIEFSIEFHSKTKAYVNLVNKFKRGRVVNYTANEFDLDQFTKIWSELE